MIDAPDAAAIAAATAARPELAARAPVAADGLRRLRCKAPAEEPSEFICRFEARGAGGRWEKRTATLARNGDHWERID